MCKLIHSVRAYKMIFWCFRGRLICKFVCTLDKMVSFFVNICCFINNFINNLLIILLFVIEHCLFMFMLIKCVYGNIV